MTDADEILNLIQSAKSVERLDWIGVLINEEIEMELEWTKDQEVLVMLRKAWAKRNQELTTPST